MWIFCNISWGFLFLNFFIHRPADREDNLNHTFDCWRDPCHLFTPGCRVTWCEKGAFPPSLLLDRKDEKWQGTFNLETSTFYIHDLLTNVGILPLRYISPTNPTLVQCFGKRDYSGVKGRWGLEWLLLSFLPSFLPNKPTSPRIWWTAWLIHRWLTISKSWS